MVGILGLAWLFLIDQPPIDFSAFPDTSPEENADVAGWLNGIVFDPLKWRSVIGNFALASWSMNLVAWSLYVEICATPAVFFVESTCRRCSTG